MCYTRCMKKQRGNWRFTEEEARCIVAEYESGENMLCLSKKHHASHNTIRHVLKRAGKQIVASVVNRKVSPDSALGSQILDQLARGASLAAIARQVNLHHETVRRVILRSGKSVPMQRRRHKRPELESQMRDLYMGGKTIREISRQFDLSSSTLSDILLEGGIVIRTPGLQSQRRPPTKEGYVEVLIDRSDPILAAMARAGKYMLEHRVVMARHLNRALDPYETVHHINGDRADNRIDNLQMRRGRHGKGIVLRCADCGSCNLREHPLPDQRAT